MRRWLAFLCAILLVTVLVPEAVAHTASIYGGLATEGQAVSLRLYDVNAAVISGAEVTLKISEPLQKPIRTVRAVEVGATGTYKAQLPARLPELYVIQVTCTMLGAEQYEGAVRVKLGEETPERSLPLTHVETIRRSPTVNWGYATIAGTVLLLTGAVTLALRRRKKTARTAAL